jgi:hypothetical protein
MLLFIGMCNTTLNTKDQDRTERSRQKGKIKTERKGQDKNERSRHKGKVKAKKKAKAKKKC